MCCVASAYDPNLPALLRFSCEDWKCSAPRSVERLLRGWSSTKGLLKGCFSIPCYDPAASHIQLWVQSAVLLYTVAELHIKTKYPLVEKVQVKDFISEDEVSIV